MSQPPANPPARKQVARVEGADGLRGVAALLVVGHHVFDACKQPELRIHRINVLRPVNDWWFSVDLFLVLSGFVLFLPYAGNVNRKFDWLDFMRRRVLRIIPAYYASLVLVTLLYAIISRALHIKNSCYPNGVLDVVLHLLLLHTLYIKTFWSWAGASWNLGLEWTWYLIFFIPVWMFRRIGQWASAATMVAVTVVYLGAVRAIAGPMSTMDSLRWMVLDDSVPGRLGEFGLGMLAAWWLANRAVGARLIRASYVLIPLVMYAGHAGPPIDYGIRSLVYAVKFALTLLVAAAPAPNVIRSLFSFRPLCWVGECSYSLYLFHLPFVTLFCTILLRFTHSEVKSFFLGMMLIPVLVLIARGSYLVFERPFMGANTPKPMAKPAAVPAI